MDKESEEFGHLFKAKIFQIKWGHDERRIFVGPQIKQLFRDQDFSTNLKSTEKKSLKGI